MKYDNQIAVLKSALPTANNILVALPQEASIDKFAAGLSLTLVLENMAKKVAIISPDTIKVTQAHLFGIDQVKNTIPSSESGNLIFTLENVVSADGKVPDLETVDWYPQNSNLNLVLKVLPGHQFNPTNITHHYQDGSFDLVFVIGAADLNSLGQTFSGAHVVNIDNQSTNTNFGQTNVVDTEASSISEIMAILISDLGLNLDTDPATNLLEGIFSATNNLTTGPSADGLGADTYLAVANCLKAGGKKPGLAATQIPQSPQPTFNLADLIPQSNQPINIGDSASDINTPPQPSPEERPVEEKVTSDIEPDWLTPKIYKGSSIG